MIKDILELPEIKNLPSKRFEYGSFVGKVLYLGWYLLIFYRSGDNKISALSFDDIDSQPQLWDLSNTILNKLDIPIQVGDSASSIVSRLGNPVNKDSILESITRMYFLKDDSLLCIGVHDKHGVVSFEVIYDKDIIKERIMSFLKLKGNSVNM